MVTVSLSEVVHEMDSFNDDYYTTYLNKQTGEFVTLSTEELGAAESLAFAELDDEFDAEFDEEQKEYPDWVQEGIKKASEVLDSNDYLPLPGKWDIHEYSIMEKFCYSLESARISNVLLNAIRGRGAFHRFKNAIRRHGITEDWYEFRDRALEKIAIGWLESHGIAYTTDDETPEELGFSPPLLE